MCRSSRDEANARPQISHCTRLGVPAGRRAAALDGRGMGTACRVGALGLPEAVKFSSKKRAPAEAAITVTCHPEAFFENSIL